jgi:hypothetical protein
VQMRSKVPLIGSLWLHLSRYVPPTDSGTTASPK